MTLKKNNLLRLDVSHIARQSPGTYRTFDLHFPSLHFEPDLDLHDLEGEITISVTDDGVAAEGQLSAKTELECTRCLEPYQQTLEIHFTEIFSFSPSQDEEDELKEHQLPPDGYIDLEPLIREYALLDIPIKHLCSEGCKGLCSVCGANLNHEDCGHRQEDIDPRMAKLKQLLDEEQMEELGRE